MDRKKRVLHALSVAGVLVIGGCADLTETQQRTLTGGAMGAAGGAAIGAIAGNAALGAGIGAATGIAGGYLWDRHRQAERAAYQRGVQSGQQR